jgi:hypothetical protein
MRFPARARRCHKDPCNPHQRQASARPGGREAPAGGGASAGRGLWAPGWPGISVALWQGLWPLPMQRRRCVRWCGRDPETHRVSPTVQDAATKTRATRTDRGQRPTRRARSARRGRGGRWPGALGPRRARGQRGNVAGAMAPAMAAVKVLSSVRAGPGNAPRLPARARRCRQDRFHPHQQRPAPDPAGEKRPPGRGGRWPGALGPRLAKVQRGAVAGAMAPAMAAALAVRILTVPPIRAGSGNALRFPRPRGTLPPGPVQPALTEASARPGGQEAPAGGGAGAGRGLWAPGGPGIGGTLWQGRWPLPWHRRWWFGL